jgi:hypothetical protein
LPEREWHPENARQSIDVGGCVIRGDGCDKSPCHDHGSRWDGLCRCKPAPQLLNQLVWRRASDAIQVRPAEVLFETWAAFRQQGIETPSISIWQTCPPGGTLWQNALTLYNTYPDLVHSDPVSGKKVFFVPSDNQDASILSRRVEVVPVRRGGM